MKNNITSLQDYINKKNLAKIEEEVSDFSDYFCTNDFTFTNKFKTYKDRRTNEFLKYVTEKCILNGFDPLIREIQEKKEQPKSILHLLIALSGLLGTANGIVKNLSLYPGIKFIESKCDGKIEKTITKLVEEDDKDVLKALSTNINCIWIHLLEQYLLVKVKQDNLSETNYVRLGDFQGNEIMMDFFLCYLLDRFFYFIRIYDETGKVPEVDSGEILKLQDFDCMEKEIEESDERIEKLEIQVEDGLTAIRQRDLKIENLEKLLESTKETIQNKESELKLVELNKELQKKNTELEKKNSEISELKIENEFLYNYENVKEIDSINDGGFCFVDPYGHFDFSDKYIFVGGHRNIIKKLKTLFPNSRFIESENETLHSQDTIGVEAVVYITNFMSHSTYHNVKSITSDYIRQIHTTKTGVSSIIKEIVQYQTNIGKEILEDESSSNNNNEVC